MKKKVLIVAYLFPPIGGGGVQRALKMAKYLGEFGWEPHILTVDPTAHVSLDESLLHQLPSNVKIHRATEVGLNPKTWLKRKPVVADKPQANQQSSPQPSVNKKGKLFSTLKKLKNYVLIPDDQVLWFPAALKKGTEVIKEHNIDMIVSTSGPYTNHLVGHFLKQRTDKPWIADFRDPWTQNMHRPGIKIREAIEDVMEGTVIRNSDVLLTVTQSFADNFTSKYGNAIKRVKVIHNGFDRADYENVEPVNNNNRFTMIYAGIFYMERNPRLLLQAIRELVDEGKLNKELLYLKFAGVFDYPGYSENMDEVKRLGLEEVTEIMGHLPHKRVLSELKGASALLLVSDVTPDAGDYIPGKLFEYMAIGNPILALSMPGESTKIIETFGLGEVVNPKSKDEIKAAVLKLYQEWEANQAKDSAKEPPAVDQYERKHQAGELAKLMNELV